jgi:ribonucleoside-diphosphate reductase alpha chain
MSSNAHKQARKVQAQTVNGNNHQASDATQDLSRMAHQVTNFLNELGEKIFLDRYALKDGKKESVAIGDTVIVAVNKETGQREIGTISAVQGQRVTVQLRDGSSLERPLEQIDKPLETRPEQMQARVARGIAAVEAPDKQAEWEENFKWLLEDWRFVPGGRILTAAGTEQNLTFYNCMPPEQEILTAAGYKPIAEVKVGDLVVTHRNRLRPVLHKFERETEEPLFIFETKKLGYDNLRVTGEHKIFAIRAEWVNTHRSRDGLRLQQEPQWIPAKELKPGDYLAAAYDSQDEPVVPIYVSEYISGYVVSHDQLYKPQKRSDYHGYLEEGGTKYPINNRLNVDGDLCYLFGRWLGDGCITHRTKTDIPSGIKIVFALDQRQEAERVARIIEEKFGVPTALKLSSTERWLDLWANSMPLGQFFKTFFGCYSYGKRIPTHLIRLPKELAFELLKGLFTADGYISDNKLGILLSNRVLATQVHQMLLRLGYLFSIKENTHRLGRRPAYRIQATANECGALFTDFFNQDPPQHEIDLKYYFEYDGLRWVRIDNIALEDYSGLVLDIEVEEDHSFISAGLAVSNCYVVPSPKDSRGGIMTTLTQMTEIMSRGGGVGINISSLRPHHAYVKGVNGRSSGAVSWGELYSFVTGLIEQGGSRRGALMLIMNVWHPDILEFINSKRRMGRITNANISVGITDDFMEAVKADREWELVFPDTATPDYDDLWDGNLAAWQAAGRPVVVHKTARARDIWDSIIESAWASAEPGVFFVERYNKMSNSWYYAPILCTNPCITKDTLLYTSQGLLSVEELFMAGDEVEVVIDGRFGHAQTTARASSVFRTGRKLIYRLQTKEGYYIRATADHRLMTPRGWVELQALRPGDTVHILNRKGGFGSEGSLELGRTLGWLIGDGTLKQDEAVLSFFGSEKRELAPMFAEHVNTLVAPLTARARQYKVAPTYIKDRDEARISSTRLYTLAQAHSLTQRKHRVPDSVLRGSEAMQQGFLQALFTADGSFQDGGPKGGSIRLAANSLELLEGVQRLLLNFGIASRIYRYRREAGYRAMPDAAGGLKPYWNEAQHELVISRQSMVVFAGEIGFLMPYKQDKLRDYIERGKRGSYSENFTATVEAIIEEGLEDVYDITEPLTHSFIGNGLVLHNCGEQGLPAWGVCNLGALNLAKFVSEGQVDWDNLGRAVRYAVRFLDNVIDATPYFFEENKQQQLGERRVGLGTMGLAEMLIRLKIRYGSPESVKFLDKLYQFIAGEAYLASADNAAEKGAFAMLEAEKFLQSGFMQGMPAQVLEAVRAKGIRNVTLLTQAPTGTTGTMVNTSTGIEPFYFWSFQRKGRMGTHEERVAVYEEWLNQNPGQPLPDYFVTAMDLQPEDHVRVQAAIQRWVDSSLSKTCNTPNSYTVEQTRQLYELMYELGCKGGTVYRDGSRDEQVLNLKQEEAPPPADKTPKAGIEWRVRPNTLHGKTYRKNTPLGTAYITINSNGEGSQHPFEVFINVAKVGSDVAADADGLGRLISLILRMPSPLTPEERVEYIVAQLRGISSGRQIGFGKSRVMSMPDAVAQALAAHAGISATGDLPGLPEEEEDGQGQLSLFPKGDLCPGCGSASLLFIEGCRKCHECGYSEC